MVNLEETLRHLPADKIAGLEFVTAKIVETGLAEMIVLYGSHARGDYKDGKTRTVDGVRTKLRSDYDILVIVDKPDEEVLPDRRLSYFNPVYVGATSVTIRDTLRPYLNEEMPVRVIVEQISRVNLLIEDRQFFFLDIQREGIELYNSGRCSFAEPPEKVPPAVRRRYAEDYFEMWFEKAKKFLKGAKFYIQESDYIESAFMLEQTFEFCYKCIGFVYTHYAPHEHDLFELREVAETYEPAVMKIFPIDNPVDKDNFQKLNLAYIAARYTRDYIVAEREVKQWRAEAEKLLAATELSCKAKIEALKQLEDDGGGW